MKRRIVTPVILLVAVLALCATVVWSEITVDDVKRIAMVLRPYQVLSGQAGSTDYEVIFVLDNEGKKLAVLKYDFGKKALTPMAGRFLDKDFGGSDASGPYSMVTTQVSSASGILYVTDAATHRAIVYFVDLPNNRVVPQQSLELKKLFNE